MFMICSSGGGGHCAHVSSQAVLISHNMEFPSNIGRVLTCSLSKTCSSLLVQALSRGKEFKAVQSQKKGLELSFCLGLGGRGWGRSEWCGAEVGIKERFAQMTTEKVVSWGFASR
jgi:hypothetical protein